MIHSVRAAISAALSITSRLWPVMLTRVPRVPFLVFLPPTRFVPPPGFGPIVFFLMRTGYEDSKVWG